MCVFIFLTISVVGHNTCNGSTEGGAVLKCIRDRFNDAVRFTNLLSSFFFFFLREKICLCLCYFLVAMVGGQKFAVDRKIFTFEKFSPVA